MENKTAKNVDANKKKRIRKQLMVFLMVVCTTFVTGCSFFSFQAKKYVRCQLDALCKNDLESYITITNSDKETVEDSIDQTLALEAEAFAAYFGVTALSDDTTEMLKSFAKDVYSYSKYKVKKQKETKDGYEVIVTVYPIRFHELAKENVDKYIDDFNKKAEDSEYLYLSDSAYQEEFVKGLVNVYEKEFDSIVYDDAKKMKVTITKKGKNTYTTDLTDVQNALISFEE